MVTQSQDDQPTEALSRRELRDSEKRPRAASSKKSQSPDKSGDAPAKSGLAGAIAKHPNAWLASALGVAFLLLGTAAVFAGVSAGSGTSAIAVVPTESADPRPQPSAIPAPGRLRTCSVAALASDPRLSAFAGFVVNATTGETLYDLNGTTAQRTGSVLKVLTAAAALNILGPTAQLSTRVIDGSAPGVIVLKGGGDPTLATTPSTVYTGAAQISTLATAAMAKYEELHPGVPITEIVLDSGMWDPSDRWDSSWLRREQSDGYQAEVTALMVDGGRSNPSKTVSCRSNSGILDAGEAFADAAGLSGITFSTGSAVGSTILAEVKSQPLSTLIDQMMEWSDNSLAENLARVTSKAMGFDGSSTSLGQAIPGALVEYGLNISGVIVRDGSGLSDLNSVSPQFMTSLMVKVHLPEKDLDIVYSALPVGGVSGTLADRFNGSNAIAAGKVIAKSGWLDSAYTLAGIVNAADGTPLSFAIYSIRDDISSDAKDAQDTFVTGLFSCGDNLSKN